MMRRVRTIEPGLPPLMEIKRPDGTKAWSNEGNILNIWSMLSVLRTENISSEQYSVVLFLLSLYKDGILSARNISAKLSIKQILIGEKNELGQEKVNRYLEIYEGFDSVLNQISVEGLNSLLQEMSVIDKDVLEDNFENIFENVLTRSTMTSGRLTGEFIQPKELTRLVCALADVPKNGRVFNPFAGLASYKAFLDKEIMYVGQEKNLKTWALGALRLMARDNDESSHYLSVDSLKFWPERDEKFDAIIASPPFQVNIPSELSTGLTMAKTLEHFLLLKGLQSLKPQGKLVAVLSMGFLFRGGKDADLREFLVRNDLIDTVISFPAGLLMHTAIPIVVIVLTEKKKKPGKVRIVDAKHFVESANYGVKVLNDSKLVEYLLSNETSRADEGFSANLVEEPLSGYGISGKEEEYRKVNDKVERIVNVAKIEELNYNLNVPRYFQENIDGLKLKEILKPFKGGKDHLLTEGKILKIKDLKDDPIDGKIQHEDIPEVKFSKVTPRQIIRSCLLLVNRGFHLRPTHFQFSGTSIFIGSNILSFEIKQSIADPAYLIKELHSDYVLEQLESFRFGDQIPVLKTEDLLEVVVKLPSIKEQRIRVENFSELSEQIRRLEIERDALIHGKEVKQFNEMASLKHTLGRPRQNILDWTENLLEFLATKTDEIEPVNKEFKEFYEADILSVLHEIKRDVNFMTEVLEKGENGLVLSQYEKTIIALSDVNAIIRQLSENGYKFKLKKLFLKSEKLNDRGVFMNETLFKTMIDNILTNANKYGFDDQQPGNEVLFELEEVDRQLYIEIRNNGNHFPKNFDREKFIAKYSTGDSNKGTGIGGYDINRIASEFGDPDWRLVLDDDPIYPVKFQFQFPIIFIK